jgi:tetratricopeptide (TPR) repeat protein
VGGNQPQKGELLMHSLRWRVSNFAVWALVLGSTLFLSAGSPSGQIRAEGTTSSPAGSPSVDATPVFIEGLGALSFPNSGAAEAQDAFRRGVLLLHSFEYTPAAEAFREAQKADPDFALAYWGEAMTHNHPLWREHDRAAAMAALERLAPTREERRAKAPTERERRYLDAVETLYAEETAATSAKAERDRLYMEALQDLHESFPDDDEARAFYALSILGSVDGTRDFATYMRAAATAQPVFDRNPKHPGAAHYLIHSFDDPIHAPLGLPAADIYAEVAPNAAHAQHMTSHIFVALGLWDRVVSANIRARDTQDAQLAERGLGPNLCGHYSSWLQYGHLQLGETEEAAALLDLCHADVLDGAGAEDWLYFTQMRARQIVDSRGWAAAERWTVPVEDLPDAEIWGEGYPSARFTYRMTDALAGLESGNEGPAKELLKGPRPGDPMAALQIDQLSGRLLSKAGRSEEGLALLRQAAEAEAALPFQFGPPVPVKPTWELLGEELAKAGRTEEAAESFRTAVNRTPGRTLSVRGLENAVAD